MNVNAADIANTLKKPGRKRIYGDLPTDFAAFEGEISRDVFFRALNNATQGDQQPLRKLWAAAEREGCNVARLPLTEHGLAAVLDKHELHSNPRRYARQMLICLGRLVTANPGQLAGLHYDRVTNNSIPRLQPDQLPRQLRHELEMWIRVTPVAIDGRPAQAGALSQRTIDDYVDNICTILAAVVLAGVRLDPTVGVGFLLKPICVRHWMRVINARCARETITKHLSALLRIARDLPDAASAEDIEYLATRLADAMTCSLELDGDEIAVLASWTEPEKYACLLSVPNELMGQARNPSVPYKSRLLAGAAAFAFVLMWEHSGIREEGVAKFDLSRDVEGKPGSRVVLRRDPACVSGPRNMTKIPEPMSPYAEDIYEQLMQVRRQISVESSLLLPGNDGRPREVRCAMETVYTQIQGVVRARLTASDVRDINAYIGLTNGVDLAEVAAGIGDKHARSLKRRFGHAASRREGPGAQS